MCKICPYQSLKCVDGDADGKERHGLPAGMEEPGRQEALDPEGSQADRQDMAHEGFRSQML